MRLGPAEIAILALVAILLLGWKKMPDMARSLGRSMRVFKSEVNEMKKDGQGAPTSVQGEVVPPPAPAAPPSVTPGASMPTPQVPPAAQQQPAEQPWRPDSTL
ncbi:MAG: Sec-independent protein translocase subunit TatA [Candidatus Lutibacillus vidarii]|nr:Sec-independent protein translocase subunit TatA [Candidatus Lutibacillus vidarii]